MLQHSLRLAKTRTDMGNHLSKFPAENVRDPMRKQVFDVSQNVTYASEPKFQNESSETKVMKLKL